MADKYDYLLDELNKIKGIEVKETEEEYSK